jgi:hypothetical protein
MFLGSVTSSAARCLTDVSGLIIFLLEKLVGVFVLQFYHDHSYCFLIHLSTFLIVSKGFILLYSLCFIIFFKKKPLSSVRIKCVREIK